MARLPLDSGEAFLDAVRCFVGGTLARAAQTIDDADTIPPELISEAARLRLFALDTFTDPSGDPLDVPSRTLLAVKAIREVAWASGSFAKLVLDQNLGQVELLSEHDRSTEHAERREKIRRGECQVALLMTEPGSGSTLRELQTCARQIDDGYALTGEKDWITGAAERELYVVLAREKTHGLGVFLVNRDQVGVTVGERRRHLGLRGLGHHRVTFKDLRVGPDAVLVQPGPDTLTTLMRFYDRKRCGQAALSLGLMEGAIARSYEYAGHRQGDGQGGLKFQAAEFRFADMLARAQAAESLCLWAASQAGTDSGSYAAAIAKLWVSEAAVEVTNAAVQSCGANGTGCDLPLERHLRDARMMTIAGGTSEVLRVRVARELQNRAERKAHPFRPSS